jgi:hypothetical protein
MGEAKYALHIQAAGTRRGALRDQFQRHGIAMTGVFAVFRP